MGDGFPKGLRPAHWMGDLVSKKLDPELAKTIPVTWFCYPGSHDAATYGKGIAEFSYKCQDKSLYEQMMTGQRMFDIRLAPEHGGKNFQAVHGAAKGTADDFSTNAKEAKDNHLAGQVMRFAKQHPTEIVILKCKFEGMEATDLRLVMANTVWNLLGERLLKAPNKQEPTPTYSSAVESNRNIIFATGAKNVNVGKEHPVQDYAWNVGGGTPHWLGEGNEKLWNEPTWQSGEIKKVLHSTEDWIESNKEKAAERNKFWVAQLQLTPVLGQNITTFFKEGGSIRPKDLALGGGIGSKGKFKGSNKELRDSKILKKPIWKKHASCIIYDFADTHTTGAIVRMNIPDDKDEKSDDEGGA
ncbi:hypothetical protein LTR37_012983 [Vermiconidia calcicola]|uniref:Uncharacterized protein n=1 Tax=Vermiconidia calcicola TaxID=1690605 RepID=A0ACC3N0H1_9PEZI|nr:hypothetical protein LTR37_012983 [Vermiconidia calcicola]